LLQTRSMAEGRTPEEIWVPYRGDGRRRHSPYRFP
jgi:hypothetical protein